MSSVGGAAGRRELCPYFLVQDTQASPCAGRPPPSRPALTAASLRGSVSRIWSSCAGHSPFQARCLSSKWSKSHVPLAGGCLSQHHGDTPGSDRRPGASGHTQCVAGTARSRRAGRLPPPGRPQVPSVGFRTSFPESGTAGRTAVAHPGFPSSRERIQTSKGAGGGRLWDGGKTSWVRSLSPQITAATTTIIPPPPPLPPPAPFLCLGPLQCATHCSQHPTRTLTKPYGERLSLHPLNREGKLHSGHLSQVPVTSQLLSGRAET